MPVMKRTREDDDDEDGDTGGGEIPGSTAAVVEEALALQAKEKAAKLTKGGGRATGPAKGGKAAQGEEEGPIKEEMVDTAVKQRQLLRTEMAANMRGEGDTDVSMIDGQDVEKHEATAGLQLDEVVRCSLTLSKPVLQGPLFSA